MNVVVLWPKLFDFWKLCRLPGVAESVFLGELLTSRFIMIVRVPFDPDLIGITPFLDGGIVEFPCPIEGPLQLFCLLLIGVQSVLVSFQVRHASGSQYIAE